MSKEKFCECCGSLLKEDGTCVCPESTKNAGKKHGNGNHSKLPKAGILAVVAALIAIVGVGILLASRTKSVELVQYLKINPSVTGLNGRGIIDMEDLFDGVSFEADLIEELEKKDAEELDNMSSDKLELYLASSGEGFLECEQALEDISVTVWKDGVEVQELTELSNGNVIKIEAKSVNPTNKYLKKRFEPGVVEFVIEGLPDGTAVDVFGNGEVKLSFFGVNGKGQVNISYKADIISDLRAEFLLEQPSTTLRNGDTVEVVVRYDKSVWDAKGYYPTETSRVFIVEGLGAYMETVEEIPEDFKRAIVGAVLAKMNGSFNLMFMGADSAAVFDRMYFGVLKKNGGENEVAVDEPYNVLYVVGKYSSGGADRYCYIPVSNLVINSNGFMEVNGKTELSDLFLDVSNWGLDEQELQDAFYTDKQYDFVEIKN